MLQAVAPGRRALTKIASIVAVCTVAFSVAGCLRSNTPIYRFSFPRAPLESGTYVSDDGQFTGITRSDEHFRFIPRTVSYSFQDNIGAAFLWDSASLYSLGGCMYAAQLSRAGQPLNYALVKTCKTDELTFYPVTCAVLQEHEVISDGKSGDDCLADDPQKLQQAINFMARLVEDEDENELNDLHIPFNHAIRIGGATELRSLQRLKDEALAARRATEESRQYAAAINDEQTLRDYVANCERCEHAADAVRLIKAYHEVGDARESLQATKNTGPRPLDDTQFFQLILCNDNADPVWVAIAAPFDPFLRVKKVRGWWMVKTGCRRPISLLRGSFELYAHNNSGKTWIPPGKNTYCAKDRDHFDRVSSSGICLDDETVHRFGKIEHSGGDDLTITFPVPDRAGG
jgi:hypothetical protein